MPHEIRFFHEPHLGKALNLRKKPEHGTWKHTRDNKTNQKSFANMNEIHYTILDFFQMKASQMNELSVEGLVFWRYTQM